MIRHASGNAATAEIALIEAAAIKAFLEDIDQVHESRLQRASARSGIAIQEQEYNWTPYRHTERLGDGQYFFKTIVKKPVKRESSEVSSEELFPSFLSALYALPLFPSTTSVIILSL